MIESGNIRPTAFCYGILPTPIRTGMIAGGKVSALRVVYNPFRTTTSEVRRTSRLQGIEIIAISPQILRGEIPDRFHGAMLSSCSGNPTVVSTGFFFVFFLGGNRRMRSMSSSHNITSFLVKLLGASSSGRKLT